MGWEKPDYWTIFRIIKQFLSARLVEIVKNFLFGKIFIFMFFFLEGKLSKIQKISFTREKKIVVNVQLNIPHYKFLTDYYCSKLLDLIINKYSLCNKKHFINWEQ